MSDGQLVARLSVGGRRVCSWNVTKVLSRDKIANQNTDTEPQEVANRKVSKLDV